MKRIAFVLSVVVVCAGLSGCRSKSSMDSDRTIFDYMQAEVAEISRKGGMAAVGIGESRNTSLAITRAKEEARKSLAQQVQIKIENLEKAFIEEIGEASGSEINQLFSSAAKQITSRTLKGTQPIKQEYDINDGITTAYVLMVLNPDVIHESLENGNAKHLYEQFRASKGFEELDKEITEFEAAELPGAAL